MVCLILPITGYEGVKCSVQCVICMCMCMMYVFWWTVRLTLCETIYILECPLLISAESRHLFPDWSGNPHFSTTEKSSQFREQILFYSPCFSSLSLTNEGVTMTRGSWEGSCDVPLVAMVAQCHCWVTTFISICPASQLYCSPRFLSSPDRPSWPHSWKFCCDISSVMSLPPLPEEHHRVVL